jgi:hypothetical protein
LINVRVKKFQTGLAPKGHSSSKLATLAQQASAPATSNPKIGEPRTKRGTTINIVVRNQLAGLQPFT